jgi:hypothetical protein
MTTTKMTLRSGAKQHGGAGPFRRDGRPALCRIALILVVCLLALFVWRHSVSAQQEGPLTSHTYTFGEVAVFTLTFPTDPRPSEARLYLKISGQPTHAYSAYLETTSVTVVRDLQATPWAPFVEVTYWWDYLSADASRLETEKQTFIYVDNRYLWQTASEKGVAVHWIAGERAQMIQSLDIAQNAIAEIQWALQTTAPPHVDIYIYPSQPDLLSAMQVAGLEWAGAVAYPELGVILVAIPPTRDGMLNMDRDIPHELTHLMLYNTLGSQGYASLPTWLNEGLATHFEARPNPDYALTLAEAHQINTLIPISELCAPFPDDANRALLAYAESASFVRYLRQTYGWSSVRNLLSTYADGKACGTGTQAALNAELSQVDWAWRVWLERGAVSSTDSPIRAAVAVLLRDAGPWLLLFGALLLPGLILVVVDRR